MSIILLKGSQASPFRPSHKGGMKMKTLEWSGAVDEDTGGRILIV
jgi:hypothetical protein